MRFWTILGCVTLVTGCLPGDSGGDGASTGVADSGESARGPESEAGSGDSSGGGPAEGCGDGEVNGDEVCDDGINDGRYGGCAQDCSALGPRCGDGEVQGEAGETCDDGNTDNGDGCGSQCVAPGAVLWEVAEEIAGSGQSAEFVDIDADGTVLVTLGSNDVKDVRGSANWYQVEDGELVRTRELDSLDKAQFLADGAYVLMHYGLSINAFGPDDASLWSLSLSGWIETQSRVSDDRSIYLVGTVQEAGFPGLLARIDGGRGVVVWDGRLGAGECGSVSPTADGAVLACADELRKIDPSGAVLWTQPATFRSQIAARSDGTFAIVDDDVVVRSFDAGGRERWSVPDNGVWTVAVDVDGSVVVAGTSAAFDAANVRKYASDGELLWSHSHPPPTGRQVIVRGLAVGPKGRTVAVGRYASPDDDDYWIRGYAP